MVIGDDCWDTIMEIDHSPGMNFYISQFVYDKDLDQLLNLWAYAGPGVQLSLSDQPSEIKKKLRQDPDLFLVAEQGEELVGAVLGGFDGRRGIIYHLAVADKCRQEGIGKALKEELEDRLRSKGCLKYYFLVTKHNKDATDFYTKIGCEVMDMYVLGREIK